MKAQIKISVRKLIEFICRYGDITAGGGARVEMAEGSQAHRKLQKSAGKDYRAEVRMADTYATENFDICVSGICDGIIGDSTIDEIKTTLLPLEEIEESYNLLHWNQAMCYAYMYAKENVKQKLTVRLTYYHIETEQCKYFYKETTWEELKAFYEKILQDYCKWAEFQLNHQQQRKESSGKLPFPFPNFRKGQREFAGRCFIAFKEKKSIFAQAPTGTGKTLSTLFPAVKGFAEEYGDKIFYLTAKTVTRSVAMSSFQLLYQKGLKANCIVLTAKDKICPLGACDIGACPYAKGHYDRVNAAIFDIITKESAITAAILQEYAAKHAVCPFELALDVSEWCDIVICDYNHVFDPTAHLKRYFDNGGDYLLLIDEAHNLVDRGRSMFSTVLSKKKLKQAEALFPETVLKKKYTKIIDFFTQSEAAMQDTERIAKPDAKLYNLAMDFCEAFDGLDREKTAEELDIYFLFTGFQYLYDHFDEKHFVYYFEKKENDFLTHIFCANPSQMLAQTTSKCRSTVFFSATLLPATYYKMLLGGNEEDKQLYIPSPFPRENLCLMIAKNVSAKYKDRENSYEDVAYYIYQAIRQKKANYLAFFPSFAYLDKVFDVFCKNFPGFNVQKQENIFSEDERQNFLKAFESHMTDGLISFAVMGGIFSEGIDFLGDLLSGVFIISVGLPQLCFERDIIKNLFAENFQIEALKNSQIKQSEEFQTDDIENLSTGSGILNLKTDFSKRGFDFAYKYPGFNRVLQAAGRVIRSETDKGFIMLLDERFSYGEYRSLFPPEWSFPIMIHTAQMGGNVIKEFWERETD